MARFSQGLQGGRVKTARIVSTIVVLAILLVIVNSALFLGFQQNLASAAVNSSISSNDLLQYEWPQMQGDPSFTHYSAGPAPEAADILWKTNITGIQSYVSAFDGMVFAMTSKAVFAIDRENGGILWSRTVPNPGPWPAVYKIDDDHMVVGNACLDPHNGQILWTSNSFSATSQPLFTDNVYVPEEKMFYVKADSYVQAWSFADPSRPPTSAWQTYVSGSGLVGSGIQYGGGKIFPGSYESHQVALDAKTGDVLWDVNTKAAMLFSGTYYDGKFFRGGTHDNTIYAFDANTGKILWTFDPGSEGGYFCSGTAAAYGMVYALNKDGGLYALNENTGDVVWRYQGPGTLIFPGNPTIADGKVYATTGQAVSYGNETGASEFACLDAYTGTVIWKMPIEAFAPRESVAVAYGKLYIIPGYVTTMVDSESGNEYSTDNQIWAIGTREWPMFRNNPAHDATGQSGPSALTLRWKFQTGGSVISSPSVVDEIAYFGSLDKNIYAVEARDGSLIWKFTTNDRIRSSPAVSNGKVYTGADDGSVYCLDAYNGSLVWQANLTGIIPAKLTATVQLRSSPTVTGGLVYVGSQDKNVYALNAESGKVVWVFQTQGPVTSSPALSDGALYITSQEPTAGALYKLNASNGSLIWKKTLPYNMGYMSGTDMQASPAVAGDVVFTSTNTGVYYAVNAKNGSTLWTYGDSASQEFILCSPIYNNGRVFLIDKFSIVSVDAINGTKLWSSFVGDELYVSPSYADNKLYVVTDQRHIYVLNATDGARLSVFTTESNSWSAPSIYEGRVYSGNNDWNVYCLANYPTLSSKISFSLDSYSVDSQVEVTGTGQLGPGLDNTTVVVSLKRPDGLVTYMPVKTSVFGNFTFTFTPQLAGNWTLVAQWFSDKSYYSSSTSETATLAVNSLPTPTPTEEPTPTPEPATPVPTLPPWDQQTIAGIPVIYVYVFVISSLMVVIFAAGLVLRRKAPA